MPVSFSGYVLRLKNGRYRGTRADTGPVEYVTDEP
jgi:hypothetical protein